MRIERISNNTARIIDFLTQHPLVESIRHVSVTDHADYELAQHYIQRGTPGILSFELRGGRRAARTFYDALKLFLRLVNIGDSKSLAAIPAETTHHQLNNDALLQVGITQGLVRLSIGIEHGDDLIADLAQALAHVTVD